MAGPNQPGGPEPFDPMRAAAFALQPDPPAGANGPVHTAADAVRQILALSNETSELLKADEKRLDAAKKLKAVQSGDYLKTLREELRLKSDLLRVATAERTVAAKERAARANAGTGLEQAWAEFAAQRAERQAVRAERRQELIATYGRTLGSAAALAEHPAARVGGNLLALAGTTAGVYARSGFSGTREQRDLDREFDKTGRELAGAVRPALTTLTAGLKRFNKALSGLTPAQQDILGAGIATGGLLGTAHLLSGQLFGIGLGGLAGKGVRGLRSLAGAGGSVGATRTGAALLGEVGAGEAAVLGAGAATGGRGLLARVGGFFGRAFGKAGLGGPVGLGLLGIEAVGGIAPTRTPGDLAGQGFTGNFPQFRGKSESGLRHLAEVARKAENRYVRFGRDNFSEPLIGDAADILGYGAEKLGIGNFSRDNLRSGSYQLEAEADRIKAEHEHRKATPLGQASFGEIGSGYDRMQLASLEDNPLASIDRLIRVMEELRDNTKKKEEAPKRQ